MSSVPQGSMTLQQTAKTGPTQREQMPGLIQQAHKVSKPTHSFCVHVATVYLAFVPLPHATSQMHDHQQAAEGTAAKGVLTETAQVVAMVGPLFPSMVSTVQKP